MIKVLEFDRSIVGQTTGWSCGPNAAEITMSVLGVKRSEQQLIRDIGTDEDGTDFVGLIENVLDKFVPDAKYTSVYMPDDPPTPSQKAKLWADLVHSIDNGYPVVMNWVAPPSNYPRGVKGSPNPRYGYGVTFHYVTAIGYDDEARAVCIADSIWPNIYWISYDQCATLIPPKGYAYGAAGTAGVPRFTLLERLGNGKGVRSETPINLFIHTEQGNSSAEQLAKFCDGSNNVSYHYTIRDGVVCRVVDPKFYSWSVLSANVFSINYCFAGSYAEWSREQWLKRDDDIAICAYLIVQDAKRFKIPLRIIKPPYTFTGPGVSDHRYVTNALKIGTHVDCGDGFPWDRLEFHISRFNDAKDDFMSALSDAEQREMLALLRALAVKRYGSRSPLRHLGEGEVDTAIGFDLNEDANLHVLVVMELARAGVKSQIDLLKEVAAADPAKHPDRQNDAALAKQLLAILEAEKRRPASTTGSSKGGQ
jgi:hypothetical protein